MSSKKLASLNFTQSHKKKQLPPNLPPHLINGYLTQYFLGQMASNFTNYPTIDKNNQLTLYSLQTPGQAYSY